nr:hypothetical protein [Tanacetum cinerariifolium]
EEVPIEESKVYSNPLFDDDEINSNELESHVESNFVESLSNHNALIDSSQKIDYLVEFSGELAHINPEITESDFDFKEEIHLIENLLYDNSSPRLPEELDAEIANTIVKSLPLLPIPVQDGEIDAVDDLHVDNSISNSENELSDNKASDFDNPEIPLPPPKLLDAEFNAGDEILVVMNDELECLDQRDEFDVSNDENDDYFSFMFAKVFSFLSAKSEDTIFDPGIFV